MYKRQLETRDAQIDQMLTLEEIYTDMSQLLDMVKPEAIAIETLFYTTNQKTVIAVAEARGVILLLSLIHI